MARVASSLPEGKGAGRDHLWNEHLLFAHPLVFDILATIVNVILLSGHVPSSFQHGLIVPIPKKRESDFSNPSKFRGITLLSTICKVF